MPKENGEHVQVEDGIRVLKGEALIYHHRHVRAGQKNASECGFCRPGSPSFVATFKVARPMEKSSVGKSDGVDEEGSDPSSYSYWFSGGDEPVQRD